MCHASVVECERARQLDPGVKLSSSAPNAYLYLGQYDRFLQSLPKENGSALILFYRGFGESHQKKLEEAVAAFRKAAQLLPSNPVLRSNLQRIERWPELEKKLPALLAKKEQLRSAQEGIELGRLCFHYRQDYAASAGFFREAFTIDPKLADDLQVEHRKAAASAEPPATSPSAPETTAAEAVADIVPPALSEPETAPKPKPSSKALIRKVLIGLIIWLTLLLVAAVIILINRRSDSPVPVKPTEYRVSLISSALGAEKAGNPRLQPLQLPLCDV